MVTRSPSLFAHARRLVLASGCLAILVTVACDGGRATPDPRVAWIEERAVPLHSIDPAFDGDDDLRRVGDALQGVDVVLLGEQTHGDGTTFLAKTRLIAYLHQRLGFDVLAMESGLFDCEVAGDRILQGRAAREMVDASVFDVWGRSRQFQPLVAYLDESRRRGSALELTGFDMQLTGKIGRDELVPALRDAAGGARDETSAFFDALTAFTTSRSRFHKTPDAQRKAFRAAAAALDRALGARDDPDARFLRQVARSTAVNLQFNWDVDFNRPVPEVMNRRDAQMAENLAWLLRERYAGRKMIVWAATSHAARNRQRIQKPLPDPGMIPMGHHLWDRIGARAYTIAFTSAQGKVATWRGSPWDLAAPRGGTLERAFADAPGDAWFLDLRGQVHAGEWLAAPVMARPMGYARMTAVWPEIVDGFVFIRTAEPSLERKE